MMMVTGRVFLLGIAIVVLFTMILYYRQDSIIFPAVKYRQDYARMIPGRAVELTYDTSCGKQKCWYVPPRSATDPKQVPATTWMLFGGNASLALFWADTIAANPDDDAGFVLFEYPGYGHCEGKPSVETIGESGDSAVAALAKYLDETPENFADATTFRLMGHSLGSGMALQFALRHPNTDRIVLVAPFTSFREMANTVVTPFLGWLIRHKLDNIDALAKLEKRGADPQVIVIHGGRDNIVPVDMGRRFEEKFPDLVDYIETPHADHVNILDGSEAYMAPRLPRPLASLDEARQAAAGDPPAINSETGAGSSPSSR